MAYWPGVGSGHLVQAPIRVPVTACGNTVSSTGLLKPSSCHTCGNA
ncbi:chaplin [Streptomyces sp. NPDC006514]